MQYVCLNCSTHFEGATTRKFCSQSCAAKFNNHKRRSVRLCAGCSCDITSSPLHAKFCSKNCFEDHKYRTVYEPRILAGLVCGRQNLKKYLIKKIGYHCFQCNRSEWLGQRLPLDLDHIDGDATNNKPTNLRLLCGNCHSITPTWKAKNKGRGRQSRGLRSC